MASSAKVVVLPRPAPQRKRALFFAGVGAAALGGLYLWFAHSSFVAVEKVSIRGLGGVEAGQIAAALRRAARRQTTLEASKGPLLRAVRAFPQIRSLSLKAVFPHELRITVVERRPVAVLKTPQGTRTAVAAEGALLGPRLASPNLPTVEVAALSARAPQTEPLAAILALLGSAPPPILGQLASVSFGAKGVTALTKGGLYLYLGGAQEGSFKWGVYRGLVSSGQLAGARYVDLREPHRPAVGTGQLLSLGAANGSIQQLLVGQLEHALGGGPSAAPPAASTVGEGQEESSSSTTTPGLAGGEPATSGSGREGEGLPRSETAAAVESPSG